MTSLKVAVRVRPLSPRESFLGSGVVVDVQGKDILVTDVKVPVNYGYDHRVRVHRFTFDYGFWSVDSETRKYASQEMVYEEFGRVVLNTVLQGYNSCVIAYGPSGSGKTYTMMGSKEENGLTPRICEGLFTKLIDQTENQLPFQIDISFMEIYNEQVFDLLQKRDTGNNKKPKLRIREHPIHGPFVEGLSTHLVNNIDDVCDLLARGNECRVNAATHIHDSSSRSHAIFTIRYSQACINESQPRELVSKLHLVDLAGSEKVAPEFCQSRVKEGGNINKSLVTLGNVISVLVELSLRSKQGEQNHQQTYVPYRDSHLTWLLKDSLGGNSHTFMLAAVSPSKECYIETVSTLRYAQRAKFVMNKPMVNKDPATEMLRSLQMEVKRLRNLLITAEKLNKKFVIKPLPDIVKLRKIMEESSRTVDLMTKHWFDKWLKTYDIVLNKVTKQKGSVSGTYLTGITDGKLCSSVKSTPNTKILSSEKLYLETKHDDNVSSSNETEFEDSTECLILCNDTVGFAKKKLGDIKELKFPADVADDTAISDGTNFNFSDLKSPSNKRNKRSLEKSYISNSDNILFRHSYTLPNFRFLSLDKMNSIYPYCNYSWTTQNEIINKESASENNNISANLNPSKISLLSDTLQIKSDKVEQRSNPAESNSDSLEFKLDPFELIVDPAALKSNLAESKLSPVELKLDSDSLKSDSTEVDLKQLDQKSDSVELISKPVEQTYGRIELNNYQAQLIFDAGEFISSTVQLSPDTVKLNTDSIALNTNLVEFRTDLVESTSDTVEFSTDLVDSMSDVGELNTDSKELSSNSIEFSTNLVESVSDTFESNTNPEKLSADIVEMNTDTVKLVSNKMKLNTDLVELNTDLAEFTSHEIELNSNSVESKLNTTEMNIDEAELIFESNDYSPDLLEPNSKSNEIHADLLELNHDSIEMLSNTVELKHIPTILYAEKSNETEKYTLENPTEQTEVSFIDYQKESSSGKALKIWDNKFNSPVSEIKLEANFSNIIGVPDKNENIKVENSFTKPTLCIEEKIDDKKQEFPEALQDDLKTSNSENVDSICSSLEEDENSESKASFYLKRNDINFSERVNEESRHFLDLLSYMNKNTSDNCLNQELFRRKDSEVMSLLSFSSLDCPVWKSLDDFLGSSEETASIQDDERPESLYSTSGLRKHSSSRKFSCSSIDSTLCSVYASTNIAKEVYCKNESEENNVHDLKRRNSKLFKQVKFHTFPSRVEENNGIEISETTLDETLTPPNDNVLNVFNTPYNINKKQKLNINLLSNKDLKDVSHYNSSNVENEVSEDSPEHFRNDNAISVVQNIHDGSLLVEGWCNKLQLSNNREDNKEDTRVREVNYGLDELQGLAISTDTSEFKSSSLRLTKANLDLLAEKLKGCNEMNEDSFKTCFAYALDVNSAKGILNSAVDPRHVEEKNTKSILLSEDEHNNEIVEVLKTKEHELSESLGFLKEPQTADFETKTYAYKGKEEMVRDITFSDDCLASSVTSNLGGEMNYQNDNTDIPSVGNELAEMWHNNLYKDESIIKENNETILTDNSFVNDFESIKGPCGTDLKPIIEDENDSEIMDKESESLFNNTFTSDSLDNFEQEMVNWANKYLTRNNSNSSTGLVPENNAVRQTVDANELGLDEFEFCAESTGSAENDNLYTNETFDNIDGPVRDTLKNNGHKSPFASPSSRSSSSDSITYVFLGTDDKDDPNRNIDLSMSHYSSVPSSVSLDSLERSAFKQKFPCLSPRTLSIDSLIAEELLAQLRNGELGSVCRNETSRQVQEKSCESSKHQFQEFMENDISKNITNGYEANITETFSPENNSSFDTLSADHINKKKSNTETDFHLTDQLEKTVDDVREQACGSACKPLQRLSLGVSECLVSEPKQAPLAIQKSATNSEIYKFCETSDLKLTVKKRLATSSQSSSPTTQERSDVERGRNINFEQLARNYKSNNQSSNTTKENIMESFVVPPPISFITDERVSSNTKIASYDRSTQTEEPYPSSTPNSEQKNSLPPNTLELILRMMEMMTETIKFLKNEKNQPPECCGNCSYRHRNRIRRRKLDYYDDLVENFHECSSFITESDSDTQQRIRSCNKYINRHFTPEHIDERKKVSTRVCGRHRRRHQEDTADETFDLPTQHQLRHKIPFDYRRKNLCCKDNCRLSAAKKCLPFKSDDYNRILPVMQPCSHDNMAIHTSSLKLDSNMEVNGMCGYRRGKSTICSQVIQHCPENHMNQCVNIRQGNVEANRSPHLKEKIPCCNKTLCDKRCKLLGYPSSASSSSEGYLSSISSTTPKQISDDSERTDFIKPVNQSTVPKSLLTKARKLKPLILNRCPENQRAVTPNTSWQNTSADSGAFFMDSPLTENKNFCNATRSPETSNLPVQPSLKETQLISEKEMNPLPLADGATTNQHNCHRDFPSQNYDFVKGRTLLNHTLKQRNLGIKKLDKLEPYFLRRVDDTEEEYLDIREKTPPGATAQTSASDSSCKGDHVMKTNSSAEDFASKISDENYSITRTDIERILASIEADKQFLRRRRNPVFERQYSPEVRIRSPFDYEEEEDSFSSASYKSLPKPILYLSLSKDPSLVT